MILLKKKIKSQIKFELAARENHFVDKGLKVYPKKGDRCSLDEDTVFNFL